MNGEAVTVCEVGLRDGLQNQPNPVSTDDKLALLDALIAAGVRDFEVTSFVSPKRVPQLADASELFARLPAVEGCRYMALVPNLKGFTVLYCELSRKVTPTLSVLQHERQFGEVFADFSERGLRRRPRCIEMKLDRGQR